MDISPDYKDLFKLLNRYKVKYLVVGAYAVIYYTEPRFTKDLDVCIMADAKNAERLYVALKKFGAPLKNISPKDLCNKNTVYQIGIAPIRVDIIVGLPGMKFDMAWKNRTKAKYDGVSINIIGLTDLIRSKRNTMRPQDVLDLTRLRSRKPTTS